MDKFLNISQHNVQSITRKIPLIKTFLENNNIDIHLINETWLNSSESKIRIPGYEFIYKNAKNKHGGVGMFIRDTLKFKLIDLSFYEDIQTIGITLTTKNGPLSILCVYCPPVNNNNNTRFRLHKFRNILNRLPRPCLVAGDFNAHHIAFGCKTTKSRGKELFELFDDNDLCLLNTGSYTTIAPPNKNPSAIDISYISPMIAPVCTWYVGKDNLGSDHYPTFIDINIEPSHYTVNENVQKHLFHKADWDKYCIRSQSLAVNFDTSCDPLNSYDRFCELLNTLKAECIPLYKRTGKHINKAPAPWWNDTCRDAVEKSRKALLDYQSSMTLPLYIEYKKCEALKKRTIIEQKRNGWRNLCASFNRFTPVSRVWNFIRRFKRIGNLKRPKNDEWIPDFFRKLSQNNDISNSDLSHFFHANSHDSSTSFLLKPFNWNEFSSALNSRRDTAPGLDEFPYIMFKNLHIDCKQKLLDILNKLWIDQIIPESWKTQCVIPILKPDKPEDDHNSYRPISLTSCIGKLVEQMIKVRLDYYIESNNIIPPTQFGFRKGKSAHDNFVAFIEDMKDCLNSQSSAVCAFLDVEGAYDNVDLHQLVKVLADIGLPGKLLKWIFNFNIDRELYVKFNNILHGPEKTSKGLMQGSSLSPILFNLYTSQIHKYVKEKVQILQFADDILVYSKEKDIDTASHKLNNSLRELDYYYSKILKLQINSNKSSVIVFGSNSKVKIKYNNIVIQQFKEKKFLGIIIDENLSFHSHIDYISKRAYRGINILRCLAGTFWGSDPKTLSMLYKSIVRSHFDYSSLAYMHANSSVLRKLDVIQNIALRIISGAMKTTPINAMEVETCIIPLRLRRLYFAEKFALKTLFSSNEIILDKLYLPHNICSDVESYVGTLNVINNQLPGINITIAHIDKLASKMYKCNIYPVYTCKYNSLINLNMNVDNEKFDDKYSYIESLASYNNSYKIYTDGSKSKDRVTSAFYDAHMKKTKVYKIDNACSIFTAEAYAIFNALIYIVKIDDTTNFTIVTDSMSVLMALDNRKLSYKTNYLVFKILDLLKELEIHGKVIKFKWVPSHQGITGNEIVDEAANSLWDEDHTDIMKVPFTDYITVLKATARLRWRRYWKEVSKDKGCWYADIQKDLPINPWYQNHKACNERKFITIINRMRFGHCQTPAHLTRMNILRDDKCSHCGTHNANLEHIIEKCPTFSMERIILASEVISILEKSDSDSRESAVHETNVTTHEVPRRTPEILQNHALFRPIFQFIVNTVQKL